MDGPFYGPQMADDIGNLNNQKSEKYRCARRSPGCVSVGGSLHQAGHICPLRIATALRERRFGQLEAGPDSRYPEVWVKDKVDCSARPFGVEAAEAVQRRTSKLVARLDRELPDGADVVLVSHGDALQILQTAFLGLSPKKHRQLPHLDRAELRELKR
eukprot:Skav223974  [mRNA]  locus=scaffold1107:218347:222470:- [translate_table: standard]